MRAVVHVPARNEAEPLARQTAAAPPAPSLSLLVLPAAAVWAALFAWLAVTRHLAGGSHAEDLGFTEQVMWNALRGHWFRTSVYQGADWNTEVDLGHLVRSDSLLAFHVEPMLLLLAPLLAFGGGAALLLVWQAIAVAVGAFPAYRLGRAQAGQISGVAVALAYLLSPLGQWAVLDDFHTTTLAAPLLLLAIERLYVARAPRQAVLVAASALGAREDVAFAVAGIGLVVALAPPPAASRRLGLAILGAGLAWAAICGLVIGAYSGGVSPLGGRYRDALAQPPASLMALLARPSVRDYLATLLGSGGWLALVSPLALVPALPSVALNVLSSSPWMASGKAHYSALVLPFVVVGAAAGLRRVQPHGPRAVRAAAAGLVASASLVYLAEGAGPLAADYAPATVTDHARLAEGMAESLPAAVRVSASSALVPRVDHRPTVYQFPATGDADVIFLDVTAAPAPTSAGDTYLRVRDLLLHGGWAVARAEDGLLLLARSNDATPTDTDRLPASFFAFARDDTATSRTAPIASFRDGDLELLDARYLPSPDAAIEPDGPRSILRTWWRTRRPVPAGTRLAIVFDLRDGGQLRAWDVAALWWNPPERWATAHTVRVDIPNVPVRQVAAWQVEIDP